jgi:hypothetical protein
MQASQIIDRLNVNDSISIVYHKHAEDRNNPDNGKFRSFVSVSVSELYATKSGVIQVKVETPEGARSFTSEAVIRSLIINDLEVVKNYSLVE